MVQAEIFDELEVRFRRIIGLYGRALAVANPQPLSLLSRKEAESENLHPFSGSRIVGRNARLH